MLYAIINTFLFVFHLLDLNFSLIFNQTSAAVIRRERNLPESDYMAPASFTDHRARSGSSSRDDEGKN